MKPTRLVPVFVLAAGAIAVVGIALTFGAAPLEVAKIATPPQLALKPAPLGLIVPAAQAAPIASGAGYFPAQFAAPTQAEDSLPPQF